MPAQAGSDWQPFANHSTERANNSNESKIVLAHILVNQWVVGAQITSIRRDFVTAQVSAAGKDAGGGGISNIQPDVPTGGCMPIGLTAQGEMVFPLQCRELIERERGPASPPVETTNVSSKAQAVGPPEESRKDKAGVRDEQRTKDA